MQHILFYGSGPNIAFHVTFPLVDSHYHFDINPAQWESKHLKEEWVKEYLEAQPKFKELLTQLVSTPGIREIVVSKYQLTIRYFPAFAENELVTASIKTLVSVHDLREDQVEIREGSIWVSGITVPKTEFFS